ncbi:thiamine pyrophosphate-dependent enzyme [Nereida sp. MMG025]|uniref:thiamine pyrophosphate-dependent enzyme n=1 Tax=Nereida sp. MMG025 TaxID=2909981 RepID=UPI001F02906F|nr:thiamine pyrophosphate-dependent enzyme [Nereida sp. MMG025]MCF6444893.1 thiamine pyrophosphate-dependent enzyme [Nereida sp. MMG025]
MPHGGKILAEQLAHLGVARIFQVPGESFLAALDGLLDHDIDVVTCRQEGGAAMMAEAHAKLTGDVGVCFVTRGPGACNASAGVHIARQDSTAMVLFVGQIARDHRGREAFQEVDYRQMFGGLAKWVEEVDQTERLGEYVRRAFAIAQAGRPGPVVLALPEDMLSADVADAPAPKGLPHAAAVDLRGAATEVMARIGQAARPLVVVGGPHWSDAAARDLQDWAEAQALPVAVGFRRQDYIDNRSQAYAGDLNVGMNPALAERFGEADLIVALGSRLGDIETKGYTLMAAGKPLVHVHAGSEEIGRVWPTDLGVVARADDMVTALCDLPIVPRDRAWMDQCRAAYGTWTTPVTSPGDVRQEEVIAWLSDHLPEDAIVTNGAGNYAAWLHRYFVYKRHGTQAAPTSGSMGYGFPAAVATKLAYPDRMAVCLAGDGCFQMTCNEMSTAVQHGAAVVTIVMNNGRYGTIRMHQEKSYPERVSGTDMAAPDFAAFARAYGGHGETVRRQAEFAPAFARAAASGLPAVIEVVLDGDVLSTGATLSATRAAAVGKMRG